MPPEQPTTSAPHPNIGRTAGEFGAPGQIRTDTVHVLSVATPAFGLPARCPVQGIEPAAFRLQGGCSSIRANGADGPAAPRPPREKTQCDSAGAALPASLKRLAMSKNPAPQTSGTVWAGLMADPNCAHDEEHLPQVKRREDCWCDVVMLGHFWSPLPAWRRGRPCRRFSPVISALVRA